MIATARWWTRHPAGSHVHMPAPIWRISPALTISLCEIASASAGGCFSVGRRYSERRVIGRSAQSCSERHRAYTTVGRIGIPRLPETGSRGICSSALQPLERLGEEVFQEVGLGLKTDETNEVAEREVDVGQVRTP